MLNISVKPASMMFASSIPDNEMPLQGCFTRMMVFASVLRVNAVDDVATTSYKWKSTEIQWFLVLPVR